MIRQQLRVALLAGGILAAMTCSSRADDSKAMPMAAGATTAPAAATTTPCAPCAPQYRTVCVNEWVPECYQATRTVYKTECKTETYTTYKCEMVPETRTRTVTCNHMVPETVTCTRKVCCKVPCWEDKIVCEKHWVTVPETKCVTKCVDHGHYECKEVECGPSIGERLRGALHSKKCGCDSCCDSCNTCCETPCPRTRTVKVWCPCKEMETHTITVCKKVCQETQCTKKVCVMKTEWHEEPYTVCKMVCHPECKTETYTVCVTHKVPCQQTRQVNVCVPVCETYTATRMVCKKVEKQVPCAPTCDACSSCCNECCGKAGLLSGLGGKLRSKFSGCGCKSSCGSCGGCGSSCGCN